MLILHSELRTEGSFGGLAQGLKVIFFFVSGIIIWFVIGIVHIRPIWTNKKRPGNKNLLVVQLVLTVIGLIAFQFPNDYVSSEPELIAEDDYGNKLVLAKGKYMLRTIDYEWTNIDRGEYLIYENDIILSGDFEESKWANRTNRYRNKNGYLIAVYENEVETDTLKFMKIIKDKN